jgi:hypothetical protein
MEKEFTDGLTTPFTRESEKMFIIMVKIQGNMEGKGKCVWNDGRQFEGDWLNNCLHGEGSNSSKNYQSLQMAEWKNV